MNMSLQKKVVTNVTPLFLRKRFLGCINTMISIYLKRISCLQFFIVFFNCTWLEGKIKLTKLSMLCLFQLVKSYTSSTHELTRSYAALEKLVRLSSSSISIHNQCIIWRESINVNGLIDARILSGIYARVLLRVGCLFFGLRKVIYLVYHWLLESVDLFIPLTVVPFDVVHGRTGMEALMNSSDGLWQT